MKAEALDFIKSKSSSLILSHVFPDPDAIGSAVGLALGLKKLGKDAKAFIPSGIIPSMSEFVSSSIVDEDPDFANYDSIIIVDTANKERASGLELCLEKSNLDTLCIDHHKSNDSWASKNLIDANAPATAIIVYELLTELGLKEIGSEISNLLFAGLVDDTGSFRFSNTTPRAFNIAAKLLENGAEPERISNLLYYSQSADRLKLQAKAIDDMKLFLGGRVALINVTNELLKSFNATADDTEGLVDVARSVKGVDVAVFIRENSSDVNTKWKVSLRSKTDDISVNAIANVFGGGGHKAAAGCTLEGEYKNVEKKIITSIQRFITA